MKIAIITTFQSFMPQYSLTGIVKDRAAMLKKYGHEVHIWVSERYNGEGFPEGIHVDKKVPFTHLADYKTMAQFQGKDPKYTPVKGTDSPAEHQRIKNIFAVTLREELVDYDVVITEDIVFQGWHLPFAVAIMEASKDLPNVRWLHAIHSVPSAFSDFWDIKLYGKKHKLVYPNASDRVLVAEQYRGMIDDVRVIPHIKDIRTFADFSQDTVDYLDTYPSIMQSDIIQLYPCSVDRLEAKRLREVMQIFAHIKRFSKSVALILATQWANVQRHLDTLNNYKKLAIEFGLQPDEDIFFTSDYKPNSAGIGKFGVGIPKHMIRELFMLSNLFIFPTREETFGLVLPEACLMGSPLVVLNGSLNMMREISGHNSLYFNFGSCNTEHRVDNWDRYTHDIALIILGRMLQSESIRTKIFMRQRYNYDYLYKTYYAPILLESRTWV